MKNFNFVFFILLSCIFNIDAQKSDSLDDLLKTIDTKENENQKDLSEFPESDAKIDLKESSEIQSQVIKITGELKSLNNALKNIVGPESEKQISESKKRRQERQKEAARRLKEGRSSSGGAYSSGYGSRGGYSGYGQSDYASSSYSPPRGKSYSGGGYGGGSWGGSWGGHGSDFGGRGSSSWEPSSSSSKLDSGLPKDKNKITTSPDSSSTDKSKNAKKSGSSITASKKSKTDNKTLRKIKTYTKSIKDELKNIMQDLKDVQPTQEKTLATRAQIYSNLFSEGKLHELSGLLKNRKDLAAQISKDKKVTIDQEEKTLWNSALPHFMNMLVFEPGEEGMPAKQQGIDSCKKLIHDLERYGIISRNTVKSAQEKIESQIISDLQKELNDSPNQKTKRMGDLVSKTRNLPQGTQTKSLLDLVNKIKNIGTEEDPVEE